MHKVPDDSPEIEPPMNFKTLAVVPILAASAFAGELPGFDALPVRAELPDVLTMSDGTKVTTKEQWLTQRVPELKQMIQHYMYGYFPPAPEKVSGKIEHEDTAFFGGKATLRLITLTFGPEGTPPINLMIVSPNKVKPAPVFLGTSFCGNHSMLDDPKIPLVKGWVPKSCVGCKDNVATEEARGKDKIAWPVETIIDGGYALATYYAGDVDPDRPDFEEGIHKYFMKPGQSPDDPHRWSTIGAWAWGMQRAMDYLVTDPLVDKSKVIALGWSRLGKTTLLAGAFDDRFAAVIPIQAGCGGTAPSRGKVGEPVNRINKVFPHWFSGSFKWFNEQPEKLPFDQHCLLALCAPRPVLYSNAAEDEWANPRGQFDMMRAADPVYKLFGAKGCEATAFPEVNTMTGGELSYIIRPGKHAVLVEDWLNFIKFADRCFKK